MKKLILGLLFISSTAFATPVVESVKQNTQFIASCSMCDGGTFVTTTTFVISEYSCGTYKTNDFEINTERRSVGFFDEDFVTISLKDNVADCRASPRKRTYTLTTTELDGDTTYTLVNPSLLLK